MDCMWSKAIWCHLLTWRKYRKNKVYLSCFSSMQQSVVYFNQHLSAAHPNAGQNMLFSAFWLEICNKETPKHGSSSGRANDLRLKGPGFNPGLDPLRL